MWTLWTLSQDLGVRPSDLVSLTEWIETGWGYDPTWYVFQFDRAVRTLGVYVQNLYEERDEGGERKYANVSDILERMVRRERAGPVDPAQWRRSTRDLKDLAGMTKLWGIRDG